jgi:hypothetical protein
VDAISNGVATGFKSLISHANRLRYWIVELHRIP